MIKRIVSGIFALAALGALGVIIGGALASGEQLIVRFLTAVIVAALALYVVSDLRLKSEPKPDLPLRHDQDQRPGELATGSFAVTPDSTVPTVSMGVDSRDLQPAARTVDVIHPPIPPLPAVVASVETSLSSMVGQDATTVDGTSSLGVGKPGDKHDAGHDTQHVSTAVRPIEESEAADPEVVYVAVGTHTYEGSLETAAANWPLPSTNSDTTIDLISPEVGSEQLPVDPALDPEPGGVAEDVTVTADVPKPEVGRWDQEDKLDLTNDEIGQVDGTTSVIDLARSTASYAGPVQTPVIDLREPITADLSESNSHMDHHSTPQAITPHPISPQSLSPSLSPSAPLPEQLDNSSPSAPARQDVDNASSHTERVAAAIAGGEQKVVETLIRQGMLSTTGPITDRDVRTMVYVAFTSNELRKIIVSRGQVNIGDEHLGPVELFDETVFQPVPQTVYVGRPAELPGPPTPADAGLISKARSGDRQDSSV